MDHHFIFVSGSSLVHHIHLPFPQPRVVHRLGHSSVFSKFNAFHSTRINWTNSQPLQAVLSQRTYLVSFFSRTLFEINNTHRRNASKNGLPTRLIIECSLLTCTVDWRGWQSACSWQTETGRLDQAMQAPPEPLLGGRGTPLQQLIPP